MPRSITKQEVYYVICLEYAYEYSPPSIRLWGFFYSFELGRVHFYRPTTENFIGPLYLYYSLDLYPCIGTKPRNEAYAQVSSWPVSLMGPNQERKYQELYMQTCSLARTMTAEQKMIISDMMKQAP
jgi:hypothetical protein